MDVVGDRVAVDLRDATLLGTQRPGEVAPVVDSEGKVGGHRLADRLAVLPALRDRQHLEVLLDAVGDLVQDVGAGGGRRRTPGTLGAVGGVQGLVDVLGGAAGDLGERLAVDRRNVLEVLTLAWRDPVAADVVVVTALHRDRAVRTARRVVNSHSR